MYAQMLWSAADSYESAKSSYKSACDPYYGYSKDDESACGRYGYERSSYESAVSELESGLRNVALFCGPCDGILETFIRESMKNRRKLEAEISQLQKDLTELEAENKALNNKIKRME